MHDGADVGIPHPIAGFVVEDLSVGFSTNHLVVTNRGKCLASRVFHQPYPLEYDGLVVGRVGQPIEFRRLVETLVAFSVPDQGRQRSIVDVTAAQCGHLDSVSALC